MGNLTRYQRRTLVASALLTIGATTGGFLGTVLTSITGGILANDLVPMYLNRLGAKLWGSEEKLSNHDLTHAVGLAMGLIIQSVAESGNYPEFKEHLQVLAEHTVKAWPKVAKRLKQRSDDNFEVLQDEEIPALFSGTMGEFLNSPVLEKESWRNLLQHWLFPEAQIWLHGEILEGVANCLYERFPLALREVLKADFEEGGRAFAGLTLSLLGEMQGCLQELQARPMREDLGDLQTILERDVQSLEELQKWLENNAEAFRELGQKIDSGFVEVLRELHVTETKIEGKIATLRGWLQGQLTIILSMLEEIKADLQKVKKGQSQISEEIQKSTQELLDRMEGKARQETARSAYILDSNRPAISNWQGRVKELETINAWLDDENRKLGFIGGIGGVGKSVLAANVFAKRSDFVRKFWADLGEAPLLSALARKILQEFQIFTAEELGKMEEKNLGTVLINCLQKQRYLLILDNFESVVEDKDYRQFLQQWLGCFSQTEILVTTQVIPALKQPQRTEIILQGLLVEEGISYLKAMGIGGTDEELLAFVSRVNGHPLTLKLVAGFLNEEMGEGAKIGDLMALGVDLLDEKIDGYHRQETVQLVTVLEASFKRLSAMLRGVLVSVLVLRGGFDVETARAISGEEVTEKELRDLQKRGLLIAIEDPPQPPLVRGENPEVPLIKGDLEGSESYEFQPLIGEYLKYKKGDLTAAHQRAILFYQGRLKPREEWETVEDVGEYLEIFHHWCELGEYAEAFDSIRDGSYSDRCVAKFLDLRGYNQLRIELYTQLVAGLPNLEDWRYGACLTSLGNAYDSLGEYQQAIALHQQHLEIKRQIGDRQGEANSLGNLGLAYNSLGEYQQAIALHQKSLEIKRQIGDRQGEANSLGNLGNAYQSLGEYQQAIALHQQHLEIARQIGDRQGEANSLGNLGNAYQSLGEYQQAIALHQQSLEIARQIGDRQGEANSLGNLGNAYQSLGEYQQAIALHQQSLEIARQIGDRQGEAASLGNLGNAYKSLGEYQQAIALHQQSLEIKHQIGDRQGEAHSLNNLGSAYLGLKNYQKVLEYCQQSATLYREINQTHNEIISLNNIATASYHLKQWPSALDCSQRILEIRRDKNDVEGEANCLLTIAAIYEQQGNIKAAFTIRNQASQLLITEKGIDALPAHPLFKSWLKLAQNGGLKFILFCLLGVFIFPVALIVMIIGIFYRLIRNLFRQG